MTNELSDRLNAAVAELRKPPPGDARARRRLDRRLAVERKGGPVILTRGRALAAAAAIAVLTSIPWAATLLFSAQPVTSAGSTTPVQFVLVAPDARSVSLVGDFNDWDRGAAPLRAGDDGVWSVVLPLARGAFSYSFLVDGEEWRADPMAPSAPDDFGRPSSVVYVSPASAP